MADRIRYLVMYDIRDTRRLRRVHDVATDYGERLQYSAYLCDLTRQEVVAFRRKLLTEINAAEDSISIFDLGVPGRKRTVRREHLGRKTDVDEPPTDSTVW